MILMQKGKNLTKSLSMEEKYNYNAFLILIRCRNCIRIFAYCHLLDFRTLEGRIKCHGRLQ